MSLKARWGYAYLFYLMLRWDKGQSLNVIHLVDRVEIIAPAHPFPAMAEQEKDSVDEHTD